jgi:myosin heavy subunit
MRGMRLHRILRGIVALLVLALVSAGGYGYYHFAYAKCRVPLAYDIRTVDAHFGITEAEVQNAIAEAESLWEDATGKNLFTYKKGASLTVSFVYDERQAETEKQHTLVSVLDRKAEVSESVRADYEKLIESYADLKTSYETKARAYDTRLRSYNTDVATWNEKGGAPSDVYRTLEDRKRSLDTESKRLRTDVETLNGLGTQINSLGEKGNALVRDYNKSVEVFNNRYSTEREFTQGDYRDGTITIYQYDDRNELVRVLAHELGHALSLDHVEDTNAIMHDVMAGEKSVPVLQKDDIKEFERVCGVR